MSHFIRLSDRFETYVGIDLHTTSMTLAALIGAEGRPLRRTIATHCTGKLLQFIRSLPRPIFIGIESMGSFFWLWDLLVEEVDALVLLDALDLSKLSPRQADTDRTVSAKIAYLMRDGLVPACYVPPRHIRHLRQLGRQWHRVTEMAASAKVQIRWQLAQNNCRGPRNINTASLHRWMAGHVEKLDWIPTMLIHHWERLIIDVEQIRTNLRRQMASIFRSSPVLEHQLQLITCARGIGDILGMIILAEFGDLHRFKNADTVACWTGLTERTHISNRQKYPGKISKAGSPTLRWALCEGGFQIASSDVYYQQIYEHLEAKTGKAAIARTAMGRRLARYVWKSVVSDTPFRIGESRKRTERANQARMTKRKRRDKRLDKLERKQIESITTTC